ncbi:hypothetical protein GCM10023144_47260 [Pigmentiphaga soli]|uniref:Uncharacterized protein n=1 Tax=Pigmentiphaga soli TaxID=1007095 RepID=A0ABP8HT09_9BURK
MDRLLIKFPGQVVAPGAIGALPAPDRAGLRVYHADDRDETYALLPLPAGPDGLRAALRQRHPAATFVELAQTTDLAGEAAGQPAPWFYVVETDVRPEAAEDFDRWYEEEHLPGLAAVPGTVSARRYVARDGSPRHYACYELARRDAFGSPAWLAVRATGWSDRVRPNFINTRRTMFRLAPDAAQTPEPARQGRPI